MECEVVYKKGYRKCIKILQINSTYKKRMIIETTSINQVHSPTKYTLNVKKYPNITPLSFSDRFNGAAVGEGVRAACCR